LIFSEPSTRIRDTTDVQLTEDKGAVVRYDSRITVFSDVVASLVAGETLISEDVLGATVGEGKVGEEDSKDESHFYK